MCSFNDIQRLRILPATFTFKLCECGAGPAPYSSIPDRSMYGKESLAAYAFLTEECDCLHDVTTSLRYHVLKYLGVSCHSGNVETRHLLGGRVYPPNPVLCGENPEARIR